MSRRDQPATLSGWPTMVPIVWRGLSGPSGSWKIICIVRRADFRGGASMGVMSWPWSKKRPSEAGTSRMIALPRVDLPQPDSPTRPSVSPASTSKLTSSTARTTPRALWYWTQRLSTESSGIARQLLFGSETGCGTMRKQRPKDRPFGPAAIEHFRATILERAANRQFGEAWHAACDFSEAAAAPAQRRWRRAEQAARVRVQVTVQQCLHRRC